MAHISTELLKPGCINPTVARQKRAILLNSIYQWIENVQNGVYKTAMIKDNLHSITHSVKNLSENDIIIATYNELTIGFLLYIHEHNKIYIRYLVVFYQEEGKDLFETLFRQLIRTTGVRRKDIYISRDTSGNDPMTDTIQSYIVTALDNAYATLKKA